MINITAVKITTFTEEGAFVFESTFEQSLNIIRGDNGMGKSTLVQAIFYGLGQEELLGGKNSKFVQSCLTQAIEKDDGSYVTAHGSSIEIQLCNGKDDLTIKRCAAVQGRDDRLVELTFGPLLTKPDVGYRKEPYYLHDGGGATNKSYGFHKRLEEFIGWELPMVPATGGREAPLYIQLIASAFLIEQKAGWSNYLSTIPYLGVSESKKRVIEFLLDLDVYRVELKRKQNDADLERHKNNWKSKYEDVERLVAADSISILGVKRYPHVDFDRNDAHLIIETESNILTLPDYLDHLESELIKLNTLISPKNYEVNAELEERLEQSAQEIHTLADEENELRSLLALEYAQKQETNNGISDIKSQIEKNEGARKISKFGAEIDSDTLNGVCPTCHQQIKDALLPVDIAALPMSIDDNIVYLKNQKKISEAYLSSCETNISTIRQKLESNRKRQKELRGDVANIRLQLVRDPRLPSEVHIRDKIKLEDEIIRYKGFISSFDRVVDEFGSLYDGYMKALSDKKGFSKDGLSEGDHKKLSYFSSVFRQLLTKFEFKSCDIRFIKISNENYLPIIDSSELVNVTLRNDSSGSDFTRVMWAYTLSLALASKEYSANHPLFIFMDEPAQHAVSNENVRELFKQLSISGCQVITANSFSNSDGVFEEQTNGVKFKLIRFEGKLLKPSVV